MRRDRALKAVAATGSTLVSSIWYSYVESRLHLWPGLVFPLTVLVICHDKTSRVAWQMTP